VLQTMSENVPPTNGAKPSEQRGLPYYETLRRGLRDTLQKKRILDKELSRVEDDIYRVEGAYLEETSSAGNIIKGFDQYIKSSTTTGVSAAGTISGSALGGGPAGRRKTVVNDTDRIFSRSSVSYMRDSDSPSSSTSTPNRTGTPTGSFTAEKTGDRKKKKSTATAEEDGDGRANKRQKLTFTASRKTQDD
jgi:chromatin modification-related protein EAF6